MLPESKRAIATMNTLVHIEVVNLENEYSTKLNPVSGCSTPPLPTYISRLGT